LLKRIPHLSKPAIEKNLSRFLQNLNRGMKEVIKT